MTTGGGGPPISRSIEMPSRPGIRMSMSTTSKLRSASRDSASSPLRAVLTS
jgi:hypothetical protein